MAIVQISRITQRKGLQENLPQLAGAEFGWSIDERRLFIGNGTLEEGAPVIGNTEILTEFSDILEFQTTYTYKGEAAGYVAQTGPTAGTPVSQSLQSWLDQWASVTDFGAVGDGVTDDTAAINRALYQLYCREVNPQIRRALFFPAGVYKISETIIIPPFATLYGEGADGSVIQMANGDDSALRAYVARTGDSLQQTGINIGNNGAITPQHVTISNLGFETLDPGVDVFLIEDLNIGSFNNVMFAGPLVQADLDTDLDDIAGIRMDSTVSLITNNVTVDRCLFTGTTFGIATEEQVQGITVSNSKFDTLYKGVALGVSAPVSGGPTGFRILHNSFDNIYAEGIDFGNISLNATGYNMFYDVGNHFNGTTSPATPVINFEAGNNISISDMFQRTSQYSFTYRRVELNEQPSIATVNAETLELGTQVNMTGTKVTLPDNDVTTVGGFDEAITAAIEMRYTITRDSNVRIGTLTVASNDGGTPSFTDDYTENGTVGVTLSCNSSGGNVAIEATTTSTTFDASFSSAINHFWR